MIGGAVRLRASQGVKPSFRIRACSWRTSVPSVCTCVEFNKRIGTYAGWCVVKERLINFKFICQSFKGFHHRLYLLLIFSQPLLVGEPLHHKVNQYFRHQVLLVFICPFLGEFQKTVIDHFFCFPEVVLPLFCDYDRHRPLGHLDGDLDPIVLFHTTCS